jgi:predicted metallopeptidase
MVREVARDVAEKLPEFSHIKASRILVVAGEARRSSWATIRALGCSSNSGERPIVRIKSRQMLYVITLRPRFFRVATPRKRIETILHELFHISERFDGTLHRSRRHSCSKDEFFGRLDPLVKRYLTLISPKISQAFSVHGLVAVRQWLEKPALSNGNRARSRRIYTEKQLFVGPVQMVTRPAARSIFPKVY